MTCDIPNAFTQVTMPKIEKGGEKVIMKIKGILLELLLEIAPEIYGRYVVMEDGKSVIYLEVLRALYGMLISALIWYRKWRGDLESIGLFLTRMIHVLQIGLVKGVSRLCASMSTI